MPLEVTVQMSMHHVHNGNVEVDAHGLVCRTGFRMLHQCLTTLLKHQNHSHFSTRFSVAMRTISMSSTADVTGSCSCSCSCCTPSLPAKWLTQSLVESSSDNIVLKQVVDDLHRYRRDLGESHLKVAETWNSLGLIQLHMQQNARDAKGYLEEALRIFESCGSRIRVAVTLNDLGYCHERLQETDKAVEAYKRALHLLEAEKSSKSHPGMISTKRSLSRLARS